MGPDESKPFRVIYSEKHRSDLRLLIRWAGRLGQTEILIETLALINEGLEFDPAAFGDPIHRLPHMNATEYRVLRGPIRVTYAVHDYELVVFVKSISYFPEYGMRKR